jgi:phage terminase large subunit-like protein
VLDTGRRWNPDAWQLAVVEDLLAGAREVWTVVPEGNGKTTFWAGFALYHGDHVEAPSVPIGASSREQAELLYRQAEGFVLRSPSIRDRFRCQEGYRRIRCLRTIGRIQIYAADDRTADGIIPTLALLDELHRHRDLRLYRTWAGKLEKRDGQIGAISTAGEPGSDFEETRAQIHRDATEVSVEGCHTRAVTPERIVLHDWAVPRREQCEDMRVVAQANPRRAITQAKLRRKRRSSTMTPAHWQRFVCNIATRISGQAVTPEDWDALREEGLDPDRSRPCFGWLDLGWKIDTTAMGMLVWESSERRVVAGVRIIEPPVDEGDVVEGLLDLQEEFLPEGFVYDPNAGGHQMAQLLEKGEHPRQVARGIGPLAFIEHSQDNAPMALAAARLDEAIRSGWLRHDGDPGLRAHVLNAVRRQLGGEKWKYDRPSDAKGEKRAKFPIDALTGVLIGHSVAVGEQDTPEKEPLVAWS